MSRSELYSRAKKLSNELNISLKGKYPRGSVSFWKKEVKRFEKLSKVSAVVKNKIIKQNILKVKNKISTVVKNKIIKQKILKVKNRVNRSLLRKTEKRYLKAFFDEAQAGDFDVKSLSLKRALRFLDIDEMKRKNKFVLIQVGDFFRPIKTENIAQINNRITEILNEEVKTGSDYDYIIDVIEKEVPFTFIIRDKVGNHRRGGAFFKYLNKLDKVDLSRYGVFHKVDKENYNVNCLERALMNSQYGDELKDNVKILMNKIHIPKKDLKIVAEKLNLHIVLNHLRENKQTRIVHFNENCDRIVNIGLLEEHYFIIEPIKYTSYCLNNYFMERTVKGKNKALNSEKEFNRIYRLRGNKFMREDRFISSLDAIKILIENKETHLKKIDIRDGILSTTHYKKCNEIDTLSVSNKDCSPITDYDLKEPFEGKFDIVYFDFEATTDGDFHKPYMICSETREGQKFYADGFSCPLKWLQSLTGNSLCIAHNLRYDLQFLLKYLSNATGMIKTGNRIKSIEGEFYNRNLQKTIKLKFKDSLGIINMPLSKFGKCFQLDQHKDVMPYELYNSDTSNEGTLFRPDMPVQKALDCLKSKEDQLKFIENCRNWDLFTRLDESLQLDSNVLYFDHMKYARIYCKADVSILKAGYEKFRQWMDEVARIDIDKVVSIPQLANKYLLERGCFEGVYKLGGVPRAFIQRCVEGGRVMTANNEKIKVVGKKIQDFDGVSLYPSAMARFDGFLKGTPKIINNLRDFNNIEQNHYFVEIEIINVPKKYKFPLITKKDENGIRQYSNDLRGRGFYVDKYKLEDLMKFHEMKPEVDFKIIRGYYFDEGFNDKIKEEIAYLFNERLIKKAAKNPIQEVYKLIMNAAYGKLIMKPIEEKISFKYGNNINKYLTTNYNSIKEFIKITDGMAMFKEIKPIDTHFSAPHCGVPVLSMSKRIMNEVMCLAEDLNINMYYTDTDSIHIDEDGIAILEEKYKEINNRELVGKKLGQFHCDFDFKSDVRPVAVESIFLGKKTYIDAVELVNDGVVSYDYHIRCKGIPSKIITDKGNPMDLYKRLYDGEEIKFDLSNVCKFKSNKNLSMSNNTDFIRRVRF